LVSFYEFWLVKKKSGVDSQINKTKLSNLKPLPESKEAQTFALD